MTDTIIAAIISVIGAILVAIISGIFIHVKKSKDAQNNIEIKQKQKGKMSTQIGQQNNYNFNNNIHDKNGDNNNV